MEQTESESWGEMHHDDVRLELAYCFLEFSGALLWPVIDDVPERFLDGALFAMLVGPVIPYRLRRRKPRAITGSAGWRRAVCIYGGLVPLVGQPRFDALRRDFRAAPAVGWKAGRNNE